LALEGPGLRTAEPSWSYRKLAGSPAMASGPLQPELEGRVEGWLFVPWKWELGQKRLIP
jgi:hypothetical protein